jgi:hypothetical protein
MSRATLPRRLRRASRRRRASSGVLAPIAKTFFSVPVPAFRVSAR